MKNYKLLAGLILGGAMLVGCEQRPEATPRTNTNTTPSTRAPATPSGTTTEARAQTLIDQINQDIAGRNFDSAQTKLNELDQMRANLPQDLQKRIDQLKAAYNTAKNAMKAPVTTPSTPPIEEPSTPPSTPPSNP